MIATKNSSMIKNLHFSLQLYSVSVKTDTDSITLTVNKMSGMDVNPITGKRNPVYEAADTQIIPISDIISNPNGTVFLITVDTVSYSMLPLMDITDKIHSKFDPLVNSRISNTSVMQAGYILVDSRIADGYVVYIGNMLYVERPVMIPIKTIPDKQTYNVDSVYSYLVPEYKAQAEKNSLRFDLLKSLDVTDSIGYLGVQGDILALLVMTMYDAMNATQKATIAKKVPRMDDFITAMKATSLLNIKDEDSCLEELTVNKQSVYNKLAGYYEAKSKLSE